MKDYLNSKSFKTEEGNFVFKMNDNSNIKTHNSRINLIESSDSDNEEINDEF
jgi:hypothetical protein